MARPVSAAADTGTPYLSLLGSRSRMAQRTMIVTVSPQWVRTITMEFNTSFRRLKKASCTDRSHWDGPIAYRDWRKKAMAPAPANSRIAAAIRTAGQTDLFFIRHFLSVYLFNYTLFLWKIT